MKPLRLATLVALSGLALDCRADTVVVRDDVTGLAIEVRYPAELLLDQLAISGTTAGAPAFAPGVVPDAARPLAAGQESVVLLVPDELAGSSVLLRVDGLFGGAVVASAKDEVDVVARKLVDVVIILGAPAICGDGVVRAGVEACDDGNLSAGDGCDSTCAVESPFVCTGEPSRCGLCGNGLCDAGEHGCTCAMDCGLGSCGDGVCCSADGESGCSCAADCGAGSCGDGVCCAADHESSCSCETDCGLGTCGDGLCCPARGENACACGVDCAGACGDGFCCGASGESAITCAADCGGCAGVCGDGLCCAAADENRCSCAADCGQSACGDGVCCAAAGEDTCSCAADCGAEACGDGRCCATAGENRCTCTADCGAGFCGDAVCCPLTNESLLTCVADCDPPPGCGNGSCHAGRENSCNCPQDCGEACGDGCCNMSEDVSTCPLDCP